MVCTVCGELLRTGIGGHLEWSGQCCSPACARAWAIVSVLERLLDVIERRNESSQR